MIVNNFIKSFDELKEASINGCFEDQTNPIDGVIYPLICADIPNNVESEIIGNLSNLINKEIENPLMFMRRSPLGVKYPHQVHSDSSMGLYSLMLYINDGIGGTSLVRHKDSGIAYNPDSQEFIDIIQADQDTPDKWAMIEMITMVPNKAFIFDSNRLHRAEPVGGFGQDETSRVILTCFFS